VALYVLSSGAPPANPVELLDSARRRGPVRQTPRHVPVCDYRFTTGGRRRRLRTDPSGLRWCNPGATPRFHKSPSVKARAGLRTTQVSGRVAELCSRLDARKTCGSNYYYSGEKEYGYRVQGGLIEQAPSVLKLWLYSRIYGWDLGRFAGESAGVNLLHPTGLPAENQDKAF
jgi:hypothetical protein